MVSYLLVVSRQKCRFYYTPAGQKLYRNIFRNIYSKHVFLPIHLPC